ncbi:MAG: AAA family ATPase [Burkholderiales bacterium]
MYTRPHADRLARRLAEPRRFIQVVAGPRQVGKTTFVEQVVAASNLASHIASADEPTLRGREWIEQQWEAARFKARDVDEAVIVLDEAQKVPNWSEVVSGSGMPTPVRRSLKLSLGRGPR